MFFSITPAPIFRGPPIQARSADVQAETAISKPVAIMKRRMSRCLALSSVEETRPRSDARADYAVSRENQNLEEKFLSVLQADPGYIAFFFFFSFSFLPHTYICSTSSILTSYTGGYSTQANIRISR